MSYKKLEVWQLSQGLVIDIHKMTLTKKLSQKGLSSRAKPRDLAVEVLQGWSGEIPPRFARSE